MEKQKINSGLYLVIDPTMDSQTLLHKLDLVLQEAIAAVQVWDNFNTQQNVLETIKPIVEKGNAAGVPVVINNRWELLLQLPFDGVHFDAMPTDFKTIQSTINRPFIAGVTCNNDLAIVQSAADHHFDYISFCSLFPSSTSNSCELVHFETVQQARLITDMPIFLAGGIKPHNLHQLNNLPYNGIAVVSGIMSAAAPNKAALAYVNELKKLKQL